MKEIERRAKLDEATMDKLIASLRERGAEFRSKKRLIADFSDSIETRNRTVMIRVNNGETEIVVKAGKGGASERQEASVDLASDLESALHMMALLGYTTASYGFRTMHDCELDGIEYSFRVARNYKTDAFIGVLLEVELKREGSVAELDQALASIGATPLNDDEFKTVINRYHAEANGVYEHSDAAAHELAERTATFMGSK